MDKLTSLRKQARKLVDKRKYAKAADVFFQLGRIEPKNPRWPHKGGEMWQKLDDTVAAVGSFERAARLYAEQGFFVRGIAICKVILAMQPDHEATQQALAELGARQRGPTRARRVTAPADSSEAPRPRPTLAPDEALDTLNLGQVLGSADGAAGSNDGTPVEIDLDEELDAALNAVMVPAATASDELLDRMPPTPLFSALDRTALCTLIEKVSLRTLDAGVLIIEQGTVGDALYVLVEGEVSVSQAGPPPIELGRLKEGAFFGEMALLSNFPRSATVTTITPCTLLEISRDTVNGLIGTHPEVLKVLLGFFRERLIDGLTRTSALFQPFGGDERSQLAARFSFVEAAEGTSLQQQNEPAEALYIVLCGDLGLQRDGQPAGTLARTDVFGVQSLLTNTPANTTVEATTQCWLLKLGRPAFQEVIMTHPQVLAQLSEISAAKQQALEQELEQGFELEIVI